MVVQVRQEPHEAIGEEGAELRFAFLVKKGLFDVRNIKKYWKKRIRLE